MTQDVGTGGECGKVAISQIRRTDVSSLFKLQTIQHSKKIKIIAFTQYLPLESVKNKWNTLSYVNEKPSFYFKNTLSTSQKQLFLNDSFQNFATILPE